MLQQAKTYAYLPAKDIHRARRFYEEKLGFKPTREIMGNVTYECAGDTAALLYETPNAGTSKASQLFFEVDDVEREVAELKKKGIELEKYDMPGVGEDGILRNEKVKNAWFKDTEGNIIAIVESLD